MSVPHKTNPDNSDKTPLICRLGDWALSLVPETGGSVAACAYRDQEILQSARVTDHAGDARNLSGFVMAPFIGRIAKGRFQFAGQKFVLPANMPPEPHAIHGHAWQSAWDVARLDEISVSLTNQHDGETGWPWPYRVTQTFSATGNVLTVDLTLTNLGETPMPAGLGWHPYFPKEGARLQADVVSAWGRADAGIIGDRPQALNEDTDLRAGRTVDQLNLDHCFTCGTNGVQINWPDRKIELRIMASDKLGHLTVYTPPEEVYFCVEPVSHAPDAVNNSLPHNETGLRILDPQQTLNAQIKLSVQVSDL